MYPNLYYLFKDLFGVEIQLLKLFQSFGFFVAMAFVAGSYVLGKELERKTNEGVLKSTKKKVKKGEKATVSELILNGLIGFVLGYKLSLLLTDFDAFTNNPPQYILSAKGNIIGGIIAAAGLAFWKWKEKDAEKLDKPIIEEIEVQPKEHVGNIVTLGAVFGLIGAKIFHLLENPDEVADMFTSINSFLSGLTMYGGLIFATIAIIWYAKKQNIHWAHMCDMGGITVMLGYGIGRIGCQVAGDGDWGINNPNPKPGWMSFLPDWMWQYSYPHNVINAGVPIEGCEGPYCSQLPVPVFPTPFYEATISILMFIVLWQMRKKIKIPGVLFGWYLMFNGFERFWIEKIRVNEIIEFLGMKITQAEIISTILFFIGLGLVITLTKKHNNQLV